MKIRRKRFWMSAMLTTVILAAFVGGCKKDDFVETPGVCPVVESTNPAAGATSVPLDQVITATFNEKMNPATITQASFTLSTLIGSANSEIPGTLTYDESGATISFDPVSPLVTNTTYVAVVKSTVKDLRGNSLQGDYIWSFSTGSALLPVVISTDPSNGATNVVLNKIIEATFNMPMDPLSLTAATFTVKQGTTSTGGTISYSGSTVYFSPSANLTANTLYTCTITTGARNADEVALMNNYIWSFTTGSTIAPKIVSTDPVDDATGVVLNKTVTAVFSMPMDPLTITTATFTINQGINPVAGIVSYSGTTATFVPAVAFASNTTYTGTITTGAENLAGVPLANKYVWSFTTLSTGPSVLSTDPVHNAIDVVTDKIVSATFSEIMDPLTLTTATFTLRHGANSVEGVVTYMGTKAFFTPVDILLPGTVYTANLTTGIKNPAGIPLAADYTWTFTTLSILNPVVVSTDPQDNAINVEVNKTVTANFNMEMDPLTLNIATFTIFQESLQVIGSVSLNGTTASFIPTVNFLPGVTYLATITTGAMSIGGIPMLNDYSWSFTTEASVVPIIIDLGTASIFGAFGGNAGITNQGLNSVINGAISTTAASTLVTGFHDGLTGDVYTETPLNAGLVTDGIYTAPPFPGTATSEAIAIQGLLDATDAYNSISPASMPGGIDPGAGELGGLTLAPGVYMSASGTFNISNGPLTLDAQGDPNATWVFQTASGLTVGIAGPTGARSVILTNGALPSNVFWYVGSAATINGAGGGTMVGTIIAMAGVTFSTPGNAVQTTLNGRAISLIASVTMVNTTINIPAP